MYEARSYSDSEKAQTKLITCQTCINRQMDGQYHTLQIDKATSHIFYKLK